MADGAVGLAPLLSLDDENEESWATQRVSRYIDDVDGAGSEDGEQFGLDSLRIAQGGEDATSSCDESDNASCAVTQTQRASSTYGANEEDGIPPTAVAAEEEHDDGEIPSTLVQDCVRASEAEVMVIDDDEDDDVIEILDGSPEKPKPEKKASSLGVGKPSTGPAAASQGQLTLTSTKLAGGFQRDGMALMMASARWQASQTAIGKAPAAPPTARKPALGGGPAKPAPTRGGAAAGNSRGGVAAGNGAGRGGGARRGGSMFARASGPPPFYKRIPGTPFIVDGFQWASAANGRWYILTHFHADHYGGLNKHFDAGTILCTPATGALAQSRLGVRPNHLRIIPYNTPTLVEGVRVTFLDANHCPGAAMVLVEARELAPSAAGCAGSSNALVATAGGKGAHAAWPGHGYRVRAYLHTGDFRWTPAMATSPFLRPYLPMRASEAHRQPLAILNGPLSPVAPAPSAPSARLEALYLDTTYSDPQYTFPPQDAVVAAAVDAVRPYASDPGVLLMFGSYTIGKERLFMAVARALNEQVYVEPAKLRTLSLLGWDLSELSVLTTDPTASRIHVVPMGYLTLGRLHDRLKVMRAAAAGAGGGSMSQNGTTSSNAGSRTAGAPARGGKRTSLGLPKRPVKRTKSSYFEALVQQSREAGAAASAAAVASQSVPAGAEGDDDEDEDGGFMRADGGGAPAARVNAHHALMQGAAAVAARAAAPRYGPFHSIVAFRPTGWAHGQGQAAAAPGGRALPSGHDTSASVAGDTLSYLEVLTQLQAHGGAAENSWERAGAAAPARAAPAAAAAVPEADRDGDDDESDGILPSQAGLIGGGRLSVGGAPAAALVGGSNAALLAAIAGAEPVKDTREVRRAKAVEATVVLSHAESSSAYAPSSSSTGAGPAAAGPAGSRVVKVRMMCQTRGGGARPRPSHASAHASTSGVGAAPVGGGGGVTLLSVPYSEHSSFSELQDAVRTLQPARVIPTVNCRSAAEAATLVARLRG